jgi:hypothetical protein
MSIGLPNINQYFKIAMSYPVERLQAVIRNQDHSIPAMAAMAAFQIKQPMEIAAKAQQASQQQTPFSVRQNLAQKGEEENKSGMLPENIGIGQLPAENMETMHAADGGIIGYADGGYVPGYAGEDGSFVSSVGNFFSGMLPKAYDDETKQKLNAIDSERRSYAKQLYDIAGPSGRNTKTPEQQMAADRLKERIDQLDKVFFETKSKGTTVADKPAPAASAGANEARISKPYPSNVKPKAVDPTAGQAVTDANANPGLISSLPALTDTNPFADKTAIKNANADKAPGIAALPSQAPKVEPTTVEPLSKIGADINRTFGVDKLKEGADSIARSYATTDEEARERFKLRPTYTPYEKYERSLQKEETDAVKDKKDAFYDALINAGLGIAAGKSQYGLQNIAEGAMVGTKQYSAAMKDLKAAAKERQKAFAMIDEARLAKTEKDFDRADALEDKIAGHQIEAKKLGIDALAKTLQITVPEATKMYDAQVAQAGADRRSNATNATHLQGIREQVAGHLAGQRIMANAYGANKDQYNVLADNARARADKWAESPAGQIALLKDPTLRDRKYREYLQEEYAAKGISLPDSLTGGGTMPGLSADDKSLIQRNLK